MSVDCKTYVGIYVDLQKLASIDTYDDKFIPYIEGHDGVDLDMIKDSMCGNYVYFGKTFGSVEAYEKDYVEIDADMFSDVYQDIMEKVVEFDLGIDRADIKPKLIVFNNYS